MLIRYFEIPADAVTPQARFKEDLGFSLMRFAEFAIDLEAMFEKDLFDNNALKYETIDEMVNHITTRMGAPTHK